MCEANICKPRLLSIHVSRPMSLLPVPPIEQHMSFKEEWAYLPLLATHVRPCGLFESRVGAFANHPKSSAGVRRGSVAGEYTVNELDQVLHIHGHLVHPEQATCAQACKGDRQRGSAGNIRSALQQDVNTPTYPNTSVRENRILQLEELNQLSVCSTNPANICSNLGFSLLSVCKGRTTICKDQLKSKLFMGILGVYG